MTAAIKMDTFNGRGSQFHLKNPKSIDEQNALIAGGSKVRHQFTPITKAEEKENMIAARAKLARKSTAKVTLTKAPWE